MNTARPLQGRRVLVVEDDYLVAMDTAEWLESAGAMVVGPFATAEEACALLQQERVDVAVVDVNLGHGPSFEVANCLSDRAVPFLFTTGYDEKTIPACFKSVSRLGKPFVGRTLIRAVCALR